MLKNPAPVMVVVIELAARAAGADAVVAVTKVIELQTPRGEPSAPLLVQATVKPSIDVAEKREIEIRAVL